MTFHRGVLPVRRAFSSPTLLEGMELHCNITHPYLCSTLLCAKYRTKSTTKPTTVTFTRSVSSWKLFTCHHSYFNRDISTGSRNSLVSTPFCRLPHPNATFPVQLLGYWRIVPLTLSRSLRRAINIALKRRTKKVSVPRTVRLIDEEGNNLGVMSSDIALKLAESKNLKLVEVKKPTSDTEAVYRLFTSKQQWEEMKKMKKASRNDPINVTKDITIFSTIGEHDLEVKMSHLKGFLERGNSARVFVQTKYRRGMDEVKEEECREVMLKKIVSELEGLGEKVSESPHQRRGIVYLFRPVK